MQVFKAFFKIAKSRFRVTSIYFAIYAVLSLLLSVLGKNFYADQFQASTLEIAINDQDASAASRALTRYLDARHSVSASGNDKEALLDQIYYRTLRYALTIPAGFQEALLSGNAAESLVSYTVPGSGTSYYIDAQITEYLTTLELYLAGGYDLDAAITAADTAAASVPAIKTVRFHKDDNSLNLNVSYYFQYFPYLLIAILFSGLAPILITLNGKDILARTSCSSLSSRRRIGEMTAGCILYSLGIWGLFLLLCLLFYGPALLREHMLHLAVWNSFAFLLFVIALTLLISCFGLDDNALNMASNTIGLSMSFLCGVFVPQSMLPPAVLQAAKFLPAYWYIRANNMLAGFGREVFDLRLYLQCIGIQFLYAAAIFSVTLVAARQIRRR